MTIECNKCGESHMRSECPYAGVEKALDNLNNTMDKIQNRPRFGRDTSVFEIEIWNAAIEAAAQVAKAYRAEVPCAEQIRKLKK